MKQSILYLVLILCLWSGCSITESSSSSPSNEMYVTSLIPCNTGGGLVTLFGKFGNIMVNLSVQIGDLNCEITYFSSNEINCSLGPGIGVKNVMVSMNGQTWVAHNFFMYYNIIISCPNNCMSNGVCNNENGICQCNIGWSSYDCSVPIPTDTPIPTNRPQECLDNPECGGPSKGYCSNSGCICISPWTGIDCSIVISTDTPITPTTPNITCEYTGNGLNINSNNPISCIGNGTTTCYNVIKDSECSTTSPYGNIKCTSNYKYGNNNLICNGTHIECTSLYLSCKVNIIDNNFHVNNILQSENIVVVTSDNYNYFTNTANTLKSIPSTSSSSSLSYYSSLPILVITLIISIIIA